MPGDDATALAQARQAVERAGGFDAELEDIESVAAHHANHYMPLVARQMGLTARRCSIRAHGRA